MGEMGGNQPNHQAGRGETIGSAVDSPPLLQKSAILRRTSIPGLIFCIPAAAVLLWMALFHTDSPDQRQTYLVVVAVALTMAALWTAVLAFCKRHNIQMASVAHLAVYLLIIAFFLIYLEGGVVVSVVTAFIGISVVALVFDGRDLRAASTAIVVVLVVSYVVHEFGMVDTIVIPRPFLFAISLIALLSGLPAPVSVFRIYNYNLRISRAEAVRLARAAEEARKETASYARDLEAATESLRNKNSDISDFTYVVSHDLRAPLINLEGFSGALREALDNFDHKARDKKAVLNGKHGPNGHRPLADEWIEAFEEIEDSLHFILSSTEKMNALVNGLLELSRIDSRPGAVTAVDLDALLAGLVDSMTHQIETKGIHLSVAPLPEVNGDPLRLSQIFGNLIDNAIKYMPDHDPRRIEVSCEEQGDFHLFTVSDSGSGIRAEDRETIFRPFKRLAGKDSPPGEGVGLSAVKKIVEKSGGKIWVEANPNGGCAFHFTWRRSSSSDAPTTAADPTTGPTQSAA
jgi:signal transduction histidine kinase